MVVNSAAVCACPLALTVILSLCWLLERLWPWRCDRITSLSPIQYTVYYSFLLGRWIFQSANSICVKKWFEIVKNLEIPDWNEVRSVIDLPLKDMQHAAKDGQIVLGVILSGINATSPAALCCHTSQAVGVCKAFPFRRQKLAHRSVSKELIHSKSLKDILEVRSWIGHLKNG